MYYKLFKVMLNRYYYIHYLSTNKNIFSYESNNNDCTTITGDHY